MEQLQLPEGFVRLPTVFVSSSSATTGGGTGHVIITEEAVQLNGSIHRFLTK